MGNKIIYWVATVLLAVGMPGSGLAQIFQAKEMVALVIPLGYPLYLFRICPLAMIVRLIHK